MNDIYVIAMIILSSISKILLDDPLTAIWIVLLAILMEVAK